MNKENILKEYEETKEFFVCMRGFVYTLQELFEDYELFDHGEWKPFGIKE